MQLDKSSARVRQMFGEIAGRYDLLNHVLSLGVDRSWRRKTVRLVPPKPDGGPILDVCTGTGDLALAYWKASGRKARIVGTDFCQPMLVLAEQKGRRAGAQDQISWLEADTQQLPFPDDEFQIVCVAFGLRNVSDTDRGLAEMARVCRPGGSVAVLEFTMPTNWLLGPLYGWYFHRVLPRIGQALAPRSNQNPLRKGISPLIIIFRPASASFHRVRSLPRGCGRPVWRGSSSIVLPLGSPRCTWGSK